MGEAGITLVLGEKKLLIMLMFCLASRLRVGTWGWCTHRPEPCPPLACTCCNGSDGAQMVAASVPVLSLGSKSKTLEENTGISWLPIVSYCNKRLVWRIMLVFYSSCKGHPELKKV